MVKTNYLAGICALSLVFFVGDAQAEKIGKAALARNVVTGLAGDAERRIKRGDDVLLNELIKTGALARAELRFLDQTILTIGAKSTVRLDAFVYNPGNRSGKIVLNTLKGAFRFVSGSAVKSAYRIETPLATIGVRGTVIDGYLNRAATLGVFILQQGGMKVCSPSMCRDVDNARDFVVVRADGRVSAPKPWRQRGRKMKFETAFPVGQGRFYIDPGNFDANDAGPAGGDRDSGSYGGPTSPGTYDTPAPSDDEY